MGDEDVEQKNIGEVNTPILQFCILCDNVTNPPGGKPVFSGVFHTITRPLTLPQFFIALRWINGLGEHTTTVKILDPDLKELFKSPNISFKLSHRVSGSDHILQFANFKFLKAGVYWIEILLDKETHSAFPIPVYEEVKEIQ